MWRGQWAVDRLIRLRYFLSFFARTGHPWIEASTVVEGAGGAGLVCLPSSVRSKIWDFSFGQGKQCPLAPLYKNLSNPSCKAVFTCLNRSRSSRVNLFSFSHARLLRSQVSPSLLCVTFRSGHILVHVSSPYSAPGCD